MEIATFKDYTNKPGYVLNSDCLHMGIFSKAVFACSACWTKLLRAHYNSTGWQK